MDSHSVLNIFDSGYNSNLNDPDLTDLETSQSANSVLPTRTATHDTSRTRYHIETAEKFAETLKNAISGSFPNNHQHRYKAVRVLLLRWDGDDLGVEREIRDLTQKFEKYGFNCEAWIIPSLNPERSLMEKAWNFILRYENRDTLIIVYYGGHGAIDPNTNQSTWHCTRWPNSPKLCWSKVQPTFEISKSDTLFLLDCCAAAGGIPDDTATSLTETIAACGFESVAPSPGRLSFTNTLIGVLVGWASQRFTAPMLHAEILRRLRYEKVDTYWDGKERRRFRATPIHIRSTRDPMAGSIELSCLETGLQQEELAEHAEPGDPQLPGSFPKDADQPPRVEELGQLQPDGSYKIPHILISVSLEPDPKHNPDAVRDWLLQMPVLANSVTVEAVYKSSSTLMVICIPAMVWDLLPEDLACSFIGYVHSPNLLRLDRVVDPAKPKVSKLTPEAHPDQEDRTSDRRKILERRYEWTGKLGDLDQAIEAAHQILGLMSNDHPDLVSWLKILGGMLERRYEMAKHIDDLDRAIKVAREALGSISKDNPDLASWFNKLGRLLNKRYAKVGSLYDLNQAIEAARQSLSLVSKDHPDLASWLKNLGDMLERKYEMTGRIDDLNNVIETERQAVEFMPEGLDKVFLLDTFRFMLEKRYNRTEQLVDLAEAIKAAQRVLQLAPKGHPCWKAWSNNLNKLERQHEEITQIELARTLFF